MSQCCCAGDPRPAVRHLLAVPAALGLRHDREAGGCAHLVGGHTRQHSPLEAHASTFTLIFLSSLSPESGFVRRCLEPLHRTWLPCAGCWQTPAGGAERGMRV